jgi:hypothetical protein
MLDFFHFWWRCVLTGWHFGNGLFSFIMGACGFISAGLFLLKKAIEANGKSGKNPQ